MSDIVGVSQTAKQLANDASILSERAQSLASEADHLATQGMLAHSAAPDATIVGLTVFMLACFVGYYVVWKVTPALHTPLMSVTNAISGIIIVGAIIATATARFGFSSGLGLLAVMIASINIFGGFIVTQRMLQMFKKKQ